VAAAEALASTEPCVTEIYHASNPSSGVILGAQTATDEFTREQCKNALWKYAGM